MQKTTDDDLLEHVNNLDPIFSVLGNLSVNACLCVWAVAYGMHACIA